MRFFLDKHPPPSLHSGAMTAYRHPFRFRALEVHTFHHRDDSIADPVAPGTFQYVDGFDKSDVRKSDYESFSFNSISFFTNPSGSNVHSIIFDTPKNGIEAILIAEQFLSAPCTKKYYHQTSSYYDYGEWVHGLFKMRSDLLGAYVLFEGLEMVTFDERISHAFISTQS